MSNARDYITPITVIELGLEKSDNKKGWHQHLFVANRIIIFVYLPVNCPYQILILPPVPYTRA